MKKIYMQPTIKIVKYSVESHIANISGGGGDTANGTIDPNVTGNGEDGLGKEDGFEWDW